MNSSVIKIPMKIQFSNIKEQIGQQQLVYQHNLPVYEIFSSIFQMLCSALLTSPMMPAPPAQETRACVQLPGMMKTFIANMLLIYFSECIGSGGSALGTCAQGFGTCCYCETKNISIISLIVFLLIRPSQQLWRRNQQKSDSFPESKLSWLLLH